MKTILLKENLGTGHGKLPDTGSKNSPCKSIFVSSDFAKRQSNTGPWLLPTLLSGVNGTTRNDAKVKHLTEGGCGVILSGLGGYGSLGGGRKRNML